MVFVRGSASICAARYGAVETVQSDIDVCAGAGFTVFDVADIYILGDATMAFTNKSCSDFVKVPGFGAVSVGLGISFSKKTFRLSLEEAIQIRSFSFLNKDDRGFATVFRTTLCPRYIVNPQYGLSVCALIEASYSASMFELGFGLGGCIEV